ncbi:MAG: SDR family oxidoreductase [bacterium]|nr:SDR family oxidoreductase [bacterium]
MADNLPGKVALITGASKGIGRATAIAFAKEGYSVVINFKSDLKSAQATLKECNRHSGRNMLVKADVSKEREVRAMLGRVKKQFRHLDILVNNAGIFDEHDGPTNTKAFENIYRNNFLSCVLVTKHALPLMRTGKIVNVSSVHARLGHGRPKAIAYAAFKAALESYTKNLAKALAPCILVNAVAPGRVATAMWGNPGATEQRKLGKDHLIKRMIQPEEIAEGIVFLVKNDAVCGEVLTIDGGMSLVTLG